MYSVLLQSRLDGQPLLLPHHGEQPLRLMDALNSRNKRAAGTGLLLWGHFCGECRAILPLEDGSQSKPAPPTINCSLCVQRLLKTPLTPFAFRADAVLSQPSFT